MRATVQVQETLTFSEGTVNLVILLAFVLWMGTVALAYELGRETRPRRKKEKQR